MVKGSWLCAIFFILMNWFAISAGAQQSKYWVYFTDKKGETFDPHTYFHPAAIERRVNAQVKLSDSTDFPVSASYLSKLQTAGPVVLNSSRWLNAVSCLMTEEERQYIEEWPFVDRIELIESFPVISEVENPNKPPNNVGHRSISHQTDVLGGPLLRDRGLNGEGMRIAVFDVGFKGIERSEYLKHLFQQNRIELTYDFVGKDENVSHSNAHGTKVLSCLAGESAEEWMGLAGGATYLLARTERNSIEIKSEEDCWIAAAEWADKHGAHIINSSLGYTGSRYFKKDMNGKTAPVSIAATMAARKGILVVSAAGNEGDEPWKFVAAPGDADSTLTVGGIDRFSELPSSFSSFGPTADGRLKPNVVAHGSAYCSLPSAVSLEQGTSFSSPLIAGYAACLWQQDRTRTNMEVLELVQSSANLYPYFDYSMGYGLPHAARVLLKNSIDNNWSFERINQTVFIQPTDQTAPTKYKNTYQLEPLVYYAFLSEEQRILSYGAAYLQDGRVILDIPDKYQNAVIKACFLGTIKEIR